MRVALFSTCLVDALLPDAGKATVTLLERLGQPLEFPLEQSCCGQMHANSGYFEPQLVRRYVDVFEGYDAVVVPSGSCAGAILTPLIVGVERAPELPFASSLCGACYEVCPVEIDIPTVLVKLRHDVVKAERHKAQDATFAAAAQAMSGRRRWTLALKLAPLMRFIKRAAPPAAVGLDADQRPPRAAARAVPRLVDEDPGAEMSARDEVLARVRSALAPEPGQSQARQIPREYRTATDDGLDEFLDRLAHYEARAIHTTPSELAATVVATLEDRGARNVITPDGVPDGWLSPKINPLKDDPRSITSSGRRGRGAHHLRARDRPDRDDRARRWARMGRRALTLLPDYHLCVVRTEQIVSSVPEALGRLDPVRPLTFISGPSATVDIEMVRVKGVHGPRTLDVILVAAHE